MGAWLVCTYAQCVVAVLCFAELPLAWKVLEDSFVSYIFVDAVIITAAQVCGGWKCAELIVRCAAATLFALNPKRCEI